MYSAKIDSTLIKLSIIFIFAIAGGCLKPLPEVDYGLLANLPVPRLQSELSSNVPSLEAGVTLSPTSGLTVNEAGTSATFTVTLNSPPGSGMQVQIDFSSTDILKGTVSPSSATFISANWTTPQTITITGVDNAIADGDVSYSINSAINGAGTTDMAYSGLSFLPFVHVTTVDNDTAGVSYPPASLTTVEGGTSKQVSVVLNSQPTHDVTIPVSTIGANASEGAVSPASLTFTSANWSVPQLITVTPANDTVIDGDLTYAIQLGDVSSLDPVYDAFTTYSISVTNKDNDKYIFATASAYQGNLGGITGADMKCMGDANYPGSGTYKAMIVDGTTRNAFPTQIDWVLQPNTSYYDPRYAGPPYIGTTNAIALFTFPLANAVPSASGYVLTGLNADFSASPYHCAGWTIDATGLPGANIGQTVTSSSAIYFMANTPCNTGSPKNLYCVEQ